MAGNPILRHENDLPDDVRALLHAPPPPGVWHLPSHPRIGHPFRVAAWVSLAVLVLALAVLSIAGFESASSGRFRSEGLAIAAGVVVFAAGLYWLCRRARKKAERLDADLQAGRLRFGLWLTPRHVLARDSEGISCARREDIAGSHVYRAGGGRPNLLVLDLADGRKIYVAVAALDGWAGQGEKLRGAFESQLRGAGSPPNSGIAVAKMREAADGYLPRQDFAAFIRWLNGEARRLEAGAVEKAALLALADTALAAWSDEARRAFDEWFLHTEPNATYEYGGSQPGGDKTYRGFRTSDASWLLPLCRSVCFDEAESILPDLAHVRDCAATFADVPLTAVEFTGGLDPEVFDAFLTWLATKPLKKLTARDYSTERSSVSNLRDSLKATLADFKRQHDLA